MEAAGTLAKQCEQYLFSKGFVKDVNRSPVHSYDFIARIGRYSVSFWEVDNSVDYSDVPKKNGDLVYSCCFYLRKRNDSGEFDSGEFDGDRLVDGMTIKTFSQFQFCVEHTMIWGLINDNRTHVKITQDQIAELRMALTRLFTS